MEKHYLYILKCCDGTYYIGHTNDLRNRLAQHNLGFVSSYTKPRRPVKIVYAHEFENRFFAFKAERRIKNWSQYHKSLGMICCCELTFTRACPS